MEIRKPESVFDRDREWQALVRLIQDDAAGAMLGLVYGRRRQGKTYLLANLIRQVGGFMYTASQESSAQSLRALSEAYCAHLRRPLALFSGWREAIDALLRLDSDGEAPVPVVIDEFSYLVDAVDGLASLFQAALDPGGW